MMDISFSEPLSSAVAVVDNYLCYPKIVEVTENKGINNRSDK